MMYQRTRSKRGLLACINDIGDGKLELTLDDLVRDKEDGSQWNLDVFVTSKDYDEEVFKNLDFDEKELADFGHYILSRLYAFYKRGEL